MSSSAPQNRKPYRPYVPGYTPEQYHPYHPAGGASVGRGGRGRGQVRQQQQQAAHPQAFNEQAHTILTTYCRILLGLLREELSDMKTPLLQVLETTPRTSRGSAILAELASFLRRVVGRVDDPTLTDLARLIPRDLKPTYYEDRMRQLSFECNRAEEKLRQLEKKTAAAAVPNEEVVEDDDDDEKN